MRYHIIIEIEELQGRFVARLLRDGPLPEELDLWEGETVPELEDAMKQFTNYLRKELSKYLAMQRAGIVYLDLSLEELPRLKKECRRLEVVELYELQVGRSAEKRAVVKCVLD